MCVSGNRSPYGGKFLHIHTFLVIFAIVCSTKESSSFSTPNYPILIKLFNWCIRMAENFGEVLNLASLLPWFLQYNLAVILCIYWNNKMQCTSHAYSRVLSILLYPLEPVLSTYVLAMLWVGVQGQCWTWTLSIHTPKNYMSASWLHCNCYTCIDTSSLLICPIY